MKKPTYIRKGKRIYSETEVKEFKFFNEAKRESRKLQMECDGALGRGSLLLK